VTTAQKHSQERPRPPASIPGIPDDIVRRGDYLDREHALELLRVKPQTLYSYVSRGWIRSVPHPDGRSSYYVREDVERVRARGFSRTGHGPAAEAILRWGEPVISTSITEIVREGPCYRDHPAVDLTRRRVPFENVAEYLWGAELASDPVLWSAVPEPQGFAGFLRSGAKMHRHAHILQLMMIAVSALGVAEGTRRERIRFGRTPIEGARRISRTLAGTFGFLGPTHAFHPVVQGRPIALGVGDALGIKLAVEQRQALDAALVLVADHELNPATFAARVAASASADIQSCIGAALSTHYGTLVGRACDRLEQLFILGASGKQMFERGRSMMSGGRMLPGFNHHLYPGGDPRARRLLELALMLGGSRRAVQDIIGAVNRFEVELDARPAMECGLVVLCRALALPDQAASGLFALGRSAGWAAHVFEQRLAGFVIRPRARFVRKGLERNPASESD